MKYIIGLYLIGLLGMLLLHGALGIEFIKRDPEKKNLKPKSLYQYIYRFMKRYNLLQREGTHIGQLLPYDSEDKIFMFSNSKYC